MKTYRLPHPALHAATVGVSDPDGCRIALMRYGSIQRYPTIRIGPLDLRGGEANWRIAIDNAQPLWLGVAWQAIEALDEDRRLDREAEQEAKEKQDMAVIAWKDTKTLEPGYYPAIVSSLEETTGEYGDQLQIQFVVLDAEGEQTDSEMRAWCSLAWSEKSKLCLWSRVLLGKRCPKPGEPMDTDRLKNKKCDIEVVAYRKKDGNDGVKIGNVLPFDTVSRKSTATDEDDESDEKDLPF